MKEVRNIIAVFMLYLVLNHVFMYKLLIPSHTIFGTDVQTQSQAFSESIEKEKSKGEFPFWTNHILGGMPTQASFFSHKQLFDRVWGIFTYPINIPVSFISGKFDLSADYQVLYYFSLFALFMYMYLRKHGCSNFGAFTGGLSFISVTGFASLFYPGHLTGKVYVIGFVPLIMLFLSYAFENRRPLLNFLLAGFVLSRLMTSHIQIFFITCVALLAYVILKTFLDLYDTRDFRRFLKFTGLSILFFCIPVMMNADQLLPRMEFKQYTQRGAETVKQSSINPAQANDADPEKYLFVTSFSQPPEDILLGYIMRYPLGMGKPYSGVLKEVESIPYYRGRYELRLSLEYIGIFVFLLSMIGAIRYAGRREVKLLIVLGAGSLLLSMGKYTVLFDLLYKMPGFSNFRIPLVYGMVSYLSFAALAGYGAHYLESSIREKDYSFLRKFLVFMVIASVLLSVAAAWGTIFERETVLFLIRFELVRQMLWGILSDVMQRYALFMYNLYYLVAACWVFTLLLWLIRRRMLSFHIAALILPLAISADLWTLNNKFIIPIPKKENVKQYMSDDSLVKFLKQDKSYFRIKSGVDEINNRWLLFDISNIEGYHPTPLRNFENTYGLMNLNNNIDSLLNIKYLILNPADKLVSTIESSSYLRTKYVKVLETTAQSVAENKEKPVVVFRNTMDYGRVFFVYNYGVVEQDDRAQMIMIDPRFNPREIAVLSKNPGTQLKLRKGSREKIEITKYTPNTVEIETDSDGDGLLVFSENWYPAWKAYLDGRKTELYRAYITLRAVHVPAGKHTVSFRYESDMYRLGQIIFWAGLLLIAGVFVADVSQATLSKWRAGRKTF